jgi:hypothetical protein
MAVAIGKALHHTRGLGIGVDVAQGVEGPRVVGVEPVHEAGQVLGHVGFEQIGDVVTHDAQGIESKGIPGLGLLNGIEQDLAAGGAAEVEAAVVAAHGDVIRIARLKGAGGACHEELLDHV